MYLVNERLIASAVSKPGLSPPRPRQQCRCHREYLARSSYVAKLSQYANASAFLENKVCSTSGGSEVVNITLGSNINLSLIVTVGFDQTLHAHTTCAV